ncbi:DNA-directed RNA polymerase III subunit RPC4 like protein [Argiope bruennichi]|uniref:DNA-directed RNA polymerase III subunit RPC4 like protein n=1 Tax=Argiope bruennichi TaxID=94029 RepID=A0A8T0F0E4_ARGBR|nr:DNA-directed RNA polymerase III subunit RPC4 like protein [Argiope bruennichi]
MDSNGTDSSITLDMIRKTAISRRGGVRVRGGRLPPIRIRDVVPASSTKKVIAPKIPQRRIAIKKETPEPSEVAATFSKDDRRDFRKFSGRGRGQRVYIQTEGSFLEQGPAFRLKKDTVEPHYERIPRSSSRMKMGMETKINASQINLLLEEYDEKDTCLDCENNMQPVRFPYIKRELKLKIKEEILDKENEEQKIKEEIVDNEDAEPKIKEEILDNEDVEPKIKEEIVDNEDAKPKIKEEIVDNKDVESKIKKELEDETDWKKGNWIKTPKQEIPDPPFCSLMEAMKLSQEDDMFLLFQLPSCFPFKICDESSNQLAKKDKSSSGQGVKVENTQDESKRTSLKDMPEGSLGKFQIMKSGRMRLALGSVDIAIENGMNEGSTAEVVSVPLANDEGDFIVLGKIWQKMIMSPILFDSEREIKNEKYI